MDIVQRFHAAWIFEAGWHGLDLLPTSLARAAAQVLGADAGSISLFGGDHRVPLGASTEAASAAERWQFTVGEGPCLAAFAHGQVVIADEATFARHWPSLSAQMRQHSPYRAVVALPLGVGATALGALDLYFTHPHPGPGFDPVAAQAVASLTYTALLGAALGTQPDLGDPDADVGADAGAGTGPLAAFASGDGASLPIQWLQAAAIQRRQDVWIAIGMTMTALGVQAKDAFALLRGWAYTREQIVEDVAAAITAGTLSVQDLNSSTHS